MKAALIITAQMSEEQLENSYLLALALLNFDHQVSLLFVDQAFANLQTKPELKKRILALKVYGADSFYQLGQVEPLGLFNEVLENMELIDTAAFEDLKSQMDVVL